MTIDSQYAYLLLAVSLIVIWLIIFVLSKNTRKEQLIMSIVFLPMGTFYEIFHFQDYWKPESILFFNAGPVRILFEDFVFSFAIVGIGSVIYEAIFGKRLVETKGPINKSLNVFLIVAINIVVILSLFFLGVNSIFAVSAAGVALVVFMLIQRKDLLINSLFSGLAVTIIMFSLYFIGFKLAANSEEILQQMWFLYGNPWGTMVLGVPLTEIIWTFIAGMFWGPLYEFVKGMRTV